MLSLFSELGKKIFQNLELLGQLVLLTIDSFKKLSFLDIKRLLKQMAHLGVDSLPIVLLTVFFTGVVITIQTAQEFIKYGAQSTVGGIVAIAMGRELAPVLTGVVMAGRVGAAITAELGSMKVTEQIDALRVMAVNPVAYLVVPRLVACIIMCPVLVIFANVIGIIGSYIVAVLHDSITTQMFISSIKNFAVPHDLIGGMIKCGFFGAIIAIVGCHKGLNTASGAEGVGTATTESVVLSIILIFFFNCILSAWLY